MTDRKPAATRGAAIKDQMAALRAVPEPAPAAEPRSTATARPTSSKRAARPRRGAQMAAEQKPEPTYRKRIPFMTDDEQHRALATARLEDGIQATTRLRAMVELWMTNPDYRRRVDRLAAKNRDADWEARGYQR